MTVFENPFIPDSIKDGLTVKQADLIGDECREVLYGGAAGGGKSVGMLVAAAQYVGERSYSALILRRTFMQLAKSDSILTLAKSWWVPDPNVHYNGDSRTFTFPSGATIEFGHMEHEDAKYNYQGGAYRFVGYDELTQFTEPMYAFLFSRQRREAASEIPLRMRATSNPGGIGHDWVKRRFIDPQTRDPRSAFIPAKLTDNPNIDQDSYTESLSYLDPMTRAQMLAGDWDAVAGGRFKPEWFTTRYLCRGDYLVIRKPGEDERPIRWDQCERFITCDPAASAKHTADYTVALVWLKTPRAELLLLDGIRIQAEIPDIVPLHLQPLADKWRVSGVWIEAVAANSGVFQLASRTRMPVRKLSTLGLDKLTRATQAINYAAEGRIILPLPGVRAGMPLEEIEAEWYRFTGDDKQDANDDAVDCVAYAARIMSDAPSVAARRAAPMVFGTI